MTFSRSPGPAAFYEAFRRHLAAPGGGAAAEAAEFQAKVRASDMRYAGEPLDVAYFPIALGDACVRALGGAVERTLGLLERATARLIEREGALEAAFGWPAERVRAVRHDPGYGLAIPCARFDSYWDGAADPRFLEVNTDGTSGMTNVERVTALFLESEGLRRALGARFRLENFPLRERVLERLLRCYGEWRGSGGRGGAAPAEPRIAIVDWRTVKTSAEFRALVRYFEERGLRATIADPRDLGYDGRELREGRGAGERIDLVYRRVVSTELFAAEPRDTGALIQAYLDRNVCVVGSFRSDVAFDKRLLSLHRDEDGSEVFAKTWTLEPGPVLDMALRDRERLVLKPGALYEGRGVRIGLETGEVVWRAALEQAALSRDHVVQERVPPPEVEIEVLEDDRLVPRRLYLSLGEYAFGGRLIGFNARAASTLVLSADDDERLLPVVKVEAR